MASSRGTSRARSSTSSPIPGGMSMSRVSMPPQRVTHSSSRTASETSAPRSASPRSRVKTAALMSERPGTTGERQDAPVLLGQAQGDSEKYVRGRGGEVEVEQPHRPARARKEEAGRGSTEALAHSPFCGAEGGDPADRGEPTRGAGRAGIDHGAFFRRGLAARFFHDADTPALLDAEVHAPAAGAPHKGVHRFRQEMNRLVLLRGERGVLGKPPAPPARAAEELRRLCLQAEVLLGKSGLCRERAQGEGEYLPVDGLQLANQHRDGPRTRGIPASRARRGNDSVSQCPFMHAVIIAGKPKLDEGGRSA